MPTDDTPATYTVPRKAGEGRPHIVIGAKGLKIVEALAAKGCLMETIAKALRMSHDTLEACRRRQPEVQAALDRGRGVLHDELVSILVQQARAGQFVPAMFLLKTRFGYKEGVHVDMNVEHGGVLVVPAEMTVEQYLAKKAADGDLIDVTPSAPAARPALYPGHAPIDHQPAPEPEPAPRPAPTGTTIARFPGPRTRRGD
jgi:hypothetical protein